MSQDLELLQTTHDTLQSKKEEREEKIAELDAVIDKRPTLSEFENMQRENAEMISHLANPDLAELRELANQGTSAIEEMRYHAKEAHKTKLIADGMKEYDVANHQKYIQYCANIDACNDVKVLYLATTSDYRSARIDYSPALINKALESRHEPTQVRFIGGNNDIR